ncbi:hypothetical protein [Oleiharenicola lentus]|uniref:hypothetical protein n=1 Tax=Oleiharenicola lentus TaxID=2508720 RepID=UPI003F663F4C
MLSPLPLSDVVPAGDLRRRQALNYQRIHDEPFRFDAMIVSSTMREAPGDWIGREILGLAVLSQTLATEPRYLEDIIAKLPGAMNSRGYLGAELPPRTVDENQVSGHNSMLRGLCEYYLWKKDPRALALMQPIVANLMLPLEPLFAEYPSDRVEKAADGVPTSLTVEHHGTWSKLATDVGAVFFTLDGLTQAYTILPSPEFRKLIETMIARFRQLDLVKIGAQTHVTLSTLRGIFRWWEEVDPRPELLELIKDRFALYREHAETEHFANVCWFGKPEWTEICGVVDAYLLTMQLWRATGERDYLTTAHRIYFNAMLYGQRPNGGFGCDICTGARGQLHVAPFPKIFEAAICCTMRGSEGLARAAQANFMLDVKAGQVWSLFYFEGDYTLRFADGEIVLRCLSEYPNNGVVKWTVLKSTVSSEKEWNFFVPPNVEVAAMKLTHSKFPSLEMSGPTRGFVMAKFALAPNDVVTLEFPVGFGVAQPSMNEVPAGYHRFFHGALLLGAEQPDTLSLRANDEFLALGRGRYECKRTGTQLAPINDLTYRSEAEARADRRQVLFPESD